MLYASDLIRWLQRKRYQYEVTFSLYMLTPTEKFIFSTSSLVGHGVHFREAGQGMGVFMKLPVAFSTAGLSALLCDLPPYLHFFIAVQRCANVLAVDTFLLLFISMIIVAASLYLPEHVMKMASRAWFYYAGDETAAGAGVGTGTRAGSGAGAAGVRQGDSGKAGGEIDGQDVLNMLGSL